MTHSVGLIAACDDRQLFNFPLWPEQRVVLAEIEQRRLNALCLGRRSGKSTMGALVLLHNLLLCPDLDGKVRRGERRYAVAVATNVAQARLIVQAAKSIIEASPLLSPMVESSTEDEITFSNRTSLKAFPCSSRGGRGWPISALLCDETAHFVDAEGYQAAERVWQALSPSAAQFGEAARLIVSSTPYGTAGFFHNFFSRAESGEIANASALHRTTAQMNPTISAEFLEAEQARDPEGFRAEYLAEFTGSGDAFLDFDLIELMEPGSLPAEIGTAWIGGLDPSFSSDPFGVAVVGHALEEPKRLLVGRACAVKPERVKVKSPEESASHQERTLGRVLAELEPYEVRSAWTDQHMAQQTIGWLSRNGIHCRLLTMTASSKSAIFSELRASLYAKRLAVPAEPDLLGELRRLRSHYSAGSASVRTPRVGNSHCDIAQALAMAVYAKRGSDGNKGGGRTGTVQLSERLTGGRGAKGGGSTAQVSLSEEQFDRLMEPKTTRGAKWSRDTR